MFEWMCILVTSCTQDFVKRRNLKKPPFLISILCFSHHPQSKKNRLRWYRWYRWFWKCCRIIKGWRSVYLPKMNKKPPTLVIPNKKIGASSLSPWKFKCNMLQKCQFSFGWFLDHLPSTFWMCLLCYVIWSLIIHPLHEQNPSKSTCCSILSPATLRQCGFRGLDRSHGSHWGGSLDWTAGHGALLKCEDFEGVTTGKRDMWIWKKYLTTRTLEGIGWGKTHQKSSPVASPVFVSAPWER